ncbi:MAG: hypothetical protein H7X88_07765 [Gloeobacteraceae cyanobacterium ES-bin-316]|nr:hypothetical protein [Ferruginibacter sp.]
MNFFFKIYSVYFCSAIMLVLLLSVSCQKEIYWDREFIALPVDSIPAIDDPGALPGCASCLRPDTSNTFTWSFKTRNAQLCGEVDTAIINLDRTALTFYGPSSCGQDSGLIFTVYLTPSGLNKDTSNLKAPYAAFYYYNTGAPYVLLSKTSQSFNFTISSYVHATRIATGTFSGFGYRQDGRAVEVSSGKFKIRLR